MWPFRPQKLSDVLSQEDIRQLLHLGAGLGSGLTLVERTDEDSYRSLCPATRAVDEPTDPFCTYFRRGLLGGKPAFEGADEACTHCEQRFARRFLHPAIASNWSLDESGLAKARCHMGLTDYLVPIRVGGQVVAGLIAGRRVESEDDRQRIRKTVGKLGKLTKAEAEGPDPKGRTVIHPADDKARDRLLQEIQSIPLIAEPFQESLTRVAESIGRFAERQFEAIRRDRDEEVVEGVLRGLGSPVESSAALRHDTETLLDELRGLLRVEFLAFFAWMAREVEERTANPSLVAASGLPWGASRRLLELDWTRLPAEIPGPRGDYVRGIDAISAVINAAVPTRDTPDGLKDKLTKCLFLAVVDVGASLPAALAFGPRVVDGDAPSGPAPQEGDFDLLIRLARSVARRYYAGVLDADRHWLAQRLSHESELRRKAEDAQHAAQDVLRKAEAERKLQARTRGFSHFNFRKLIDQCLQRTRAAASSRDIEFDDRALPERLMYDGDRSRLEQSLEELLLRCIERSRTDSPGGKPAPIRVFLKRVRDSLVFGAEAVGSYFDGAERRRVFQREDPRAPRERAPRERDRHEERPAEEPPHGDGGAIEPQGEPVEESREGAEAAESGSAQPGGTPAAGMELPPTLGAVLATVRRHGGRLRVESERLRRFEGDPHQWIGRTAYTLELPLWGRAASEGEADGKGSEAAADAASERSPSGRRRRPRRRRSERPEPAPGASSQEEGPGAEG